MRRPSRAAWRRHYAGLVLCLVAGSCGRNPPPAQDAGPTVMLPTPPAAPVALDIYLRETLLAAGRDRAGTRALFGAPDSVTRVAITNRHDPSITDSVATLHYPDAEYVFYVVTSGPRDLLDQAIITGNRHLRHAPGIGTPADSVRAWFGKPYVARAGALQYDCLDCEVPLPVTFMLADGRVHAVRFDLYVD